MKVYRRNKINDFEHPEDMEKILSYLEGCGEILVSPKIIEKLYHIYSKEVFLVDWKPLKEVLWTLSPQGEELLKNFESWLEKYSKGNLMSTDDYIKELANGYFPSGDAYYMDEDGNECEYVDFDIKTAKKKSIIYPYVYVHEEEGGI